MTDQRGSHLEERTYAHVQDDEVRKLFLDLALEMTEIARIRQEIQKLRSERDEERAANDDEREKFYIEIDKLKKEKDVLRAALAPDKEVILERQARGARYDKRQVLIIRIRSLESKVGIETERTRHSVDNLTRLNTRLEKAKEGGMPKEKTAKECAHKLVGVKQKIAKADANKDPSLKKYLNEKAQLEQAEAKLTTVSELQAELEEELQKAERSNPEISKNELKKCEDELQKVKDDIEQWEQKNASTPEEVAAERAKEDVRIKKIKVKLDELTETINEKRQAADFGKSEIAVKMQELSKEKNEIDEKIRALEKNIPKAVVVVKEGQSLYDVTGPGNAKLNTFQSDFGVVIDIRRQENEIIIKGTNCDDCAEAVDAILTIEAANRVEEQTSIDPYLSAEFIGVKGSNIQLFQTKTGTNINFDRSTGSIVVQGSEENIVSCMELINEFKAASHRETLKYGKNVESVMRPKLAKKWQDDYSVRLIRIDPSEHTLTIVGKADAAKNAAVEIGSMLDNMGDNTVVIPSNVSHYAIIGKGGGIVNAIQEETNTFVDVSETKVIILGTKENVARAKELVEAKVRDNIHDEVRISYNTKMHNYLMRHRPVAGKEVPEGEEAPPQVFECLLETLRRKYDLSRLQADLKTKTILARGPRDKIPRAQKELKDLLEFKDCARAKLTLPLYTVRWLTVNKNEAGKKGVSTRLDPVRAYEGVEEVLADFRAESPIVEVIGTEEGVEKAKVRVEALADICEKHKMEFEIDATHVGRLLGARGANRQQIETDYDVLVHTPPREDPPAPRGSTVTITVIGRDMHAVRDAIIESQASIA